MHNAAVCLYAYMPTLYSQGRKRTSPGGGGGRGVIPHQTVAMHIYQQQVLIFNWYLNIAIHSPCSLQLLLCYISIVSMASEGDSLEKLTGGIFLDFFYMYRIQHCFICRPSDSLCRRMLGSNPGLSRLLHWQSEALTTRLDLIHIDTGQSWG